MPVHRPKNKLPASVFLLILGFLITASLGFVTNTRFSSSKKGTSSEKALAQTPLKPAPEEIVQVGEVRSLPGKLDTVSVFNSNSPEWIKTEGILLSTFPTNRKKVSAAHLNFPFQGRFDLFAHHYTHTPKDLQTLYLGLILHNPSQKPVTVDVLQAASYLMQDAPFVTLINSTNQNQTVYLTLETPLKEDTLSKGGLRFRKPSLDFPFFRGTVRLRYIDDKGEQKTRYVHLWHRTGQILEPLIKLVMPSNSRRTVQIDLIYPPDSTPPQVLTVKTLDG
ncbi:hypothetical protein WA1_38505 [Scytonema hofmannii PCC 7110]|uniref:DUF3370 domain-containing protein n=1 Tax=Scytonema hofmannii PCC 7110 TaxID=128403 RepID=A0A139X0K4_9CYAN|nr:DUF3370 family protein [Scytonema hofmannii]KYC38237.1 hypothetical protein WA1_38505 [Scytonema hofmannii PCC 7110]